MKRGTRALSPRFPRAREWARNVETVARKTPKASPTDEASRAVGAVGGEAAGGDAAPTPAPAKRTRKPRAAAPERKSAARAEGGEGGEGADAEGGDEEAVEAEAEVVGADEDADAEPGPEGAEEGAEAEGDIDVAELPPRRQGGRADRAPRPDGGVPARGPAPPAAHAGGEARARGEVRRRRRTEARGARLVTANLRLVVKIAYEYRRAYKNIMDLVQEGNIGLMQAVKRYDPYRGVKLSSYAAWWIRAYILRFILNNWRLVKLGTTQAQRKLFFNLSKKRAELQAMGIEPTNAEIAKQLDVPENEVAEMDVRLAQSENSLDAPVGDADGRVDRQVDMMPERRRGPRGADGRRRAAGAR